MPDHLNRHVSGSDTLTLSENDIDFVLNSSAVSDFALSTELVLNM